jgi:hypothetical protein
MNSKPSSKPIWPELRRSDLEPEIIEFQQYAASYAGVTVAGPPESEDMRRCFCHGDRLDWRIPRQYHRIDGKIADGAGSPNRRRQAFTARPVDVQQSLIEAEWYRMSVPPRALFRQFVFRWQSPNLDQTGGPDRSDVSSFELDTRLYGVSWRCTASLSPGCSRHDPQQHGEHGR